MEEEARKTQEKEAEAFLNTLSTGPYPRRLPDLNWSVNTPRSRDLPVILTSARLGVPDEHLFGPAYRKPP